MRRKPLADCRLVVRQGYAQALQFAEHRFRVISVQIVVDIDLGALARVEHENEAPLRTQRTVNTGQGSGPAVSGNKVQGAVHQDEIKFSANFQLEQILPARFDLQRPLPGQPVTELKRCFTYVKDNYLRA